MNSKDAISNVKKVPSKFDKTGGAISGNVSVTGNVTSSGDIFAKNNQKVYHPSNKPSLSELGAAASNHTHDVFNQEVRFYTGSYTDPWSGTSCAIKATGNIAATGTMKAGTVQAGTGGKYAQLGSGGTDVYMTNSASNRYMQLKDDGRFCYNDYEVWTDANTNHIMRGSNETWTRNTENGFDKTKSGFQRHNGAGGMSGGLAIHVAHPTTGNGEHSRGFLFDYASSGVKTYAFDSSGNKVGEWDLWTKANFDPNTSTVRNATRINDRNITVGGNAPSNPGWGDLWITW